MLRYLFSILTLLLGIGAPISAQARNVALELVLAVDTSTSVDEREFNLQRQGFAEAFAHPDIIAAIEGMGDLGIAVTLVEWAGPKNQETIVDWQLINSASSALEFSAAINSAPRAFNGMTDIRSAIRFSVSQIENNLFDGYRQVIDVSGDGTSSFDGSYVERDRAIARGITINGLVIFTKDYDLGALAEVDLIQHYSNQVVGGNGAFLMTASSFENFRTAIKNKLLREIIGTTTASLQ
ncbi:MAG: DUF1194 domain-containing protein [Pseudomonadota bacterium]